MSQTVIFSIGAVVFAITVWGAVMAGGIWLGQLAEPEDERAGPQTASTDRGPDEPGTAPKNKSD